MEYINKYLQRLRNIASNELIYVTSDILIKAIAFISMPFFINVMTTEDFGKLSLYQTYIGIFAIFFGLNVSSAIVRYYVDKQDARKYLATAVWIVIIGGVVFSGLVLGGQYLLGLFGMESKVLATVLTSTVFTCLVIVGLEVIRSEKNSVLYGVLSVINSVISTALGLILVYTMKSDLAFWRLISICISSVVIGCVVTIRLLYRDGIKGNLHTAKYLLTYSLPLIPYTLSTTILAHVNKLFLAGTSLSEVGIFSFASNLAMIIYIIAIALNRSLQPYLFEALRDRRDYNNQLKQNIIVFYFFYVSFIFGTDILIWIFGNNNYLGAAKVIPLLTLGYGYYFLYSLYINFLYFYKKNFTISLSSVISAIVAVLTNFILIKPFGYIGAALATLISYFTLFVFGYIYVSKRLGIKVFSSKTLFVLHIMLIIPVIVKMLIQ